MLFFLIVLVRGGNSAFNKETGQTVLVDDQTIHSTSCNALLNSWKFGQPIVLIAGNGYNLFPYDLGHRRYVVLGYYLITHAWGTLCMSKSAWRLDHIPLFSGTGAFFSKSTGILCEVEVYVSMDSSSGKTLVDSVRLVCLSGIFQLEKYINCLTESRTTYLFQSQAIYLLEFAKPAYTLALLFTIMVGSALNLTVVYFSVGSTVLLCLRIPADIILIF